MSFPDTGAMTANELTYWQGLFQFGMVVILKIACFGFGYLIVKLGAALLREGVRGEFKFGAGLNGVRADLASASPGLLFALIGTVLIGYAMFVDKTVESFFEPEGGAPTSEVRQPKIEIPAEVLE